MATRTLRYLDRYAEDYTSFFVSWQPRDRNVPTVDGYRDVLDDFYARVPPGKARGLHHTRLNLGSAQAPGLELAEFTNGLAERYRIEWVNEDLGIWHLRGKILPYPLPPILTDAGLAASVRNVRAWREALTPRLRVEFPGFSDGASFSIGTWHAYDYFRCVIEDGGAEATLDVGHLLGWQWQRGRRGEALFEELDRLPLDRCVEIHLSGCAIVGQRFIDAHHGILLDEQLELLARLLPRCPALELVTYEDPRFDEEGVLVPKSLANYQRLRAMVAHG